MIKATRISKMALLIRRALMLAAPLTLGACDADSPKSKEIFIEAVPADSSLFASNASADKKAGAESQTIHLNFDDSAYFVTPTSSLLYRGEYLTYVRDQGYLKPGSILVANRTASWHGPVLMLPPLERGRAYSASVWIKLYETEQPANVKLIWTQISDGVVTNLPLAETKAEPRVWLKLEGEFIDNARSDSDINTLSIDVDNAEMKYLVDDLMVTYAELSAELQAAAASAKAVVANLITNGGLEQGLEPWTHQGGVISRSSAYAHSGEYSLLIAGRKQEWNAPMMPVRGLQNDKLYRFSLFVRMNDGEPATNVRLTMKRVTAGQTTFFTLGGDSATSAGWTEITGTFTAGNITESESVAVYLEAEHPTVSFFVDSLTVDEIPQG